MKTMAKFVLMLAALAPIAAPGVSMAQSALPDPSVPGSGYQAPVVPHQAPGVQPKATQPLAGALADPSVPGSGYQIPEARPGSRQPPYQTDPLAGYLYSNSERYGK